MKIETIESIINERRYYTGTPLETGKTSIASSGIERASPAIVRLYRDGYFKQGMTVLDFGAGKYHRNSTYLRDKGIKVFAYDPFNGDDAVDGWGSTTTTFPRNIKFDVVFTAYVLNVVPYNVEKNIIAQASSLGRTSIHITRNTDIVDTLVKTLARNGDNPSKRFFREVYAKNNEELLQKLDDGELTRADVMALAQYGVQTTRGFQRIPELEESGFNLLIKKAGYKVYIK